MPAARGQVRDCLTFAFGDHFARDSGRELPGLVGEVLFFLGLVFVEEDRVGSTGTVAGAVAALDDGFCVRPPVCALFHARVEGCVF